MLTKAAQRLGLQLLITALVLYAAAVRGRRVFGGDFVTERVHEWKAAALAAGSAAPSSPVFWVTAQQVLLGLTLVVGVLLVLSLVWLTSEHYARMLALFITLFLVPLLALEGLQVAGVPISILVFHLMMTAVAAALLSFAVRFPRSLSHAELERYFRGFTGSGIAILRSTSHLLAAPRWIWPVAAVWGLVTLALVAGIGIRFPAAAPFLPALSGGLLGWYALWAAVLAFRVNYVQSDPVDRRRMLWVLQGMLAFGAGMFFLGSVALANDVSGAAPLQGVFDALVRVPMLLLLLFLAMAVFYDGALDPRLAIRRTTVYGALGPLLVILFAGLENLFVDFALARFGIDEQFGIWAAAGMVALGFGPLRDVLQKQLTSLLGAFPKPHQAAGAAEPAPATHQMEVEV